MNELATKWVERLESEQDIQARNYLKQKVNTYTSSRVDGYCCLGVLCDIVDSSAFQLRHDHHLVYSFMTNTTCDGYVDSFPPDEIYRQAGLNTAMMKALADLNDMGSYSFTDIAHVIRLFLADDFELPPLNADDEWQTDRDRYKDIAIKAVQDLRNG